MQQMPLGTSNHLAKLVSCYCRWLAPVVLPLLHLLELELLLGSFDSHSGWSGGVRFSFFFLFYFCFPSSFAAVCLSVWAFLQVSSPFTAVNPHKAILRVKGHQLPQLANLFCSCVQRGRAAGKVPSGGRGKGGNVAMYYSPACPCF